MDKLWRIVALLGAAALVTGCVEVRSLQPVGTTAVPIVADDWTGTWLSGDGAVQIVVDDERQGRLTVWMFDPEDRELTSCQVLLRGFEPWTFGNLRCGTLWSGDAEAELEAAPESWLWGRVLKGDGEITFWAPDGEAFRDLVRDSVLPGSVDDDGNVTVALGEEQLAALVAGDYGVVLDWEDPLTLVRVGR